MTYTTPKLIKDIMRKLPSSITDEDIQLAINKAEAYVNGSLGGVFRVPFNPVPQLIEDVTTDLSIFFLSESLYSSSQPNLDEYQVNRLKRAKEMLEEIAKGDLVLIVNGQIVKPKDSGASGYATTNDQQIFNYEDPRW
jgi:phage gp36-like protein